MYNVRENLGAGLLAYHISLLCVELASHMVADSSSDRSTSNLVPC